MERLRDAKWACQFLGLNSKQRVYELARRGVIPCVRIVRQVRFDEDALREFVRHGGTATQIAKNENGRRDGSDVDVR